MQTQGCQGGDGFHCGQSSVKFIRTVPAMPGTAPLLPPHDHWSGPLAVFCKSQGAQPGWPAFPDRGRRREVDIHLVSGEDQSTEKLNKSVLGCAMVCRHHVLVD
jgi:hypothetical protein